MAETTRITVTLPAAQVAELKNLTDNISEYVAEAVARRMGHRAAGAGPGERAEGGAALTGAELAEARARTFGGAEGDASGG